MRRLFIAAAIASIAGALMHCSQTTELVVAVDTDLAPGSEVDQIDVAVDGPSGRVFEKDAGVVTSSALPLTLGVAAGSSDDAEVRIVATASKSGVAVARTEVIARFVPGESHLVQVSICKSCGLTCGKNLGSSLPEWNDALPTTNACTTTFADAGNFDSGRPPDDATTNDANEGGSTTDAPVDSPVVDAPFDAAICGDVCPTNTSCKAQGCVVASEPSCANAPIEVFGPRRFTGKVCAATSASAPMCADAGAVEKVHAFTNASAGTLTLKVTSLSQQIRVNRVDSTCAQIGGNTCATLNINGGTSFSLASGQFLAIGYEGTSGCADYRVDVP